jgi:ribonuclease R
MLPTSLSNGMCSLNPNEDRFVLAVEMLISPAGKILDYKINKGIIRSSYRMTYKKVTKILQGDKALTNEYKDLAPMLFLMAELAKILIARRNNAGQLDFDIPEPEIILNDDGTVADIHRKPRELSDRIIEQYMVLTNEVVARHFDKLKIPFVYRVHETPTVERTNKFRAFAGSLGLRFCATGKEPSPKDFQILLRESSGQDYSTALSKVMLRSMQKARYEIENLGHFGLALNDYCHFTSPIRRYPDLTIHRIISEMIDGKLVGARLKELEQFVEFSAERSSTTERQAEEAERTVDDQKATEFMQTKIGEVFDGIVSGVSPNGFFVELDNTVEGFVGLERLPQGRYEYNEDRYSISGVGQVYKIGDRIRVRVVSTDIALRHVNFELENFHREVIDRKEEMISAMDYRKEKRNSHQNHSKNHSKSNKNHRRR